MVQVSIIANGGKSNRRERRSHRAIHPSATADPTAALATVARLVRRCARRAVVDGEDQVARHAVLGSSGRDAVQTAEARDGLGRPNVPRFSRRRVESNTARDRAR